MANQTSFEMTGKLVIGKESEKFKPYEEKVSDSGWFMKTLKFNVISDTNRHNLQVKSGNWKDEKKATVYSFTKKTKNDKGEEVKGQSIQVKWSDRNKPEILETIAEFKKFVVDLEKPNRRYLLKQLIEAQSKKQEITEDKLKEVGLTSIDELDEAMNKSNAKRHEFIHESDFIDFLKKLMESGKVKDKVFTIKGNKEYYKKADGTEGSNLVPTRIYLAEDDVEQKAVENVVVYINKDSLDTLSLDDTGKYFLNAFVRVYDNSVKKDVPFQERLVLVDDKENEKRHKQVEYMVNKFFTVEDDSWKEIGLQTEILNGSQRIEVTEDMFSDVQKEMIELEMMTVEEAKEEVRREIGKDGAFGDRIQETRIVTPMKNYTKTGCKETGFTDEDFFPQEVTLDEEEDENPFVENEENEEDIFDDVDDIDLD